MSESAYPPVKLVRPNSTCMPNGGVTACSHLNSTGKLTGRCIDLGLQSRRRAATTAKLTRSEFRPILQTPETSTEERPFFL
ncbi:hypothetical protein RRG08_056202 [Elysia crispata]|uniref:Uncharacterized protein n=1 Tax=Elysia crispata TaxID=231223 RepID=A0AAE0YLS8_9GAST|nr:hypothetical protein RRG08_056202 [Elysia crispata]